MRVALATCEKLPPHEMDDGPLHEALAEVGVEYVLAAWSDPAIDWASFDACLLRTTWDYQERLDEFVAWAEHVAGTTRLFNPIEIVRWNTHKSYLRDLADAGIPTAPTVWLARGAAASVRDLVDERGWRRAFLKPAVGATARETLRFDADAEGLAAAQAHVDRLLPAEDLLLQPYLARVETDGELSAIFIEGVLSHAVRKVPVAGDYRTQDDFGAHDEPAELTADQRELAERVLRTLDTAPLYGRVDFLAGDDGGLVVTELELVEPSLFFRHGRHTAHRLAAALKTRLVG